MASARKTSVTEKLYQSMAAEAAEATTMKPALTMLLAAMVRDRFSSSLRACMMA